MPVVVVFSEVVESLELFSVFEAEDEVEVVVLVV